MHKERLSDILSKLMLKIKIFKLFILLKTTTIFQDKSMLRIISYLKKPQIMLGWRGDLKLCTKWVLPNR